MNKMFSGTGVALVTPFKKDFSIDFEKIDILVNRAIANGIDYIVALGTTAETPTLSYEERKQILETILESVNERVPVVAGIGCNNPIEVNEQIHFFDLRKVSAILSVTPYYNRPQQQGLIAHYKSIAEQSPLPVILYNVPARTGVNIEAATTLQIARSIPKVIGIKEASGNLPQIMEIIHNRPEDFLVISGDDAITLPLLACGADGVISVVANAFPRDFSFMVQHALRGDFARAKTYHYKLLDCISACFRDGNPAGVKAFLQAQGLIDDYVRLPLCTVHSEIKQLIRNLLQIYDNGI
ncbi:MAG: 4-hydroxy-tetrahydrodipicolinate synthase [Bacteroidales bacterium]|jgi:4-hydroxy-tetrahydrodipicolinate synthase|nr:4-hydroxy-tetrahydrodipicolinate synthase [Bacteroidales bacterium]